MTPLEAWQALQGSQVSVMMTEELREKAMAAGGLVVGSLKRVTLKVDFQSMLNSLSTSFSRFFRRGFD